MVARDVGVRDALLAAAREEEDHLAWCGERLRELDSRPSLLNPLWYGMSFAIGAATGLMGDKISLGFVAATEDQVCRHLDRHLQDLPARGRAQSRDRGADARRRSAPRHGRARGGRGGLPAAGERRDDADLRCHDGNRIPCLGKWLFCSDSVSYRSMISKSWVTSTPPRCSISVAEQYFVADSSIARST